MNVRQYDYVVPEMYVPMSLPLSQVDATDDKLARDETKWSPEVVGWATGGTMRCLGPTPVDHIVPRHSSLVLRCPHTPFLRARSSANQTSRGGRLSTRRSHVSVALSVLLYDSLWQHFEMPILRTAFSPSFARSTRTHSRQQSLPSSSSRGNPRLHPLRLPLRRSLQCLQSRSVYLL